MLASEVQRSNQGQGPESAVDPGLRGLLDHIATELAEEYIRLMEAAAEAEADRVEGDH